MNGLVRWWKDFIKVEQTHVWKAVAETTMFPWHRDYKVITRYFCSEKRARNWATWTIGRYGKADIYFKVRRGRDRPRGITVHKPREDDSRVDDYGMA